MLDGDVNEKTNNKKHKNTQIAQINGKQSK